MFCLIITAKFVASWCCHLQAQRRAIESKTRSLALTKVELLFFISGNTLPTTLFLDESCFSKISRFPAYLQSILNKHVFRHLLNKRSFREDFVYLEKGHSFFFIRIETLSELCSVGMLGYNVPLVKK